MRTAFPALLAASLALAASACSSSRAADAAEGRAYAQLMKDSTIADLVKARPEAEDRLALSAGWAVLGTVGHRVLLPGVADGVVVTHDNETGRETYLQMWGTVARDLPAERLRAVLFFDDAATLRHFAKEGWDFGPKTPMKGIEVVPMVNGLPAPDISLDGARVRADSAMNAR